MLGIVCPIPSNFFSQIKPKKEKVKEKEREKMSAINLETLKNKYRRIKKDKNI